MRQIILLISICILFAVVAAGHKWRDQRRALNFETNSFVSFLCWQVAESNSPAARI